MWPSEHTLLFFNIMYNCRNANVQAMITTSSGKFFSNGLDLDWLTSADRTTSMTFNTIHFAGLLLRLLTFPVPTIAAINGMSKLEI